jgi:membrane-associated phospholipid phosphatase
MLLSEIDRRAGALGWAYALALGATLVYCGEHYVIDLLAGLGLAIGVNAAARWLTPATRRLGPGRS